MSKIRDTLREHLHFIVVVTLLTLVMTFPTIVYVFRADVFWLPTGFGRDVFIKFWDIWYAKQVLTGQADPFFTNLVYYPDGLSLAFHPLFYPHSIVINVLQGLMPLANAYSLTYLLIIFSSALAAYGYLLWLCKDKWVALFGAVVFGLHPQTIALPTWPEIAWIAPIPLVMYCLHRGFREQKPTLIAVSGIVSGLTILVTPYLFVVVLIMLGLSLCAFALREWRSRRFWLHAALLAAAIALSSAWRLLPMLQDSSALNEATSLNESGETITSLAAFFVNKGSPAFRAMLEALTQQAELPGTSWHTYLGLIPIVLIGFSLYDRQTRKRGLPWAALSLVFIVLSLGSTLHIVGHEATGVLLPKHYLNQLLPSVFQGFNKPSLFLSGARLPLALLACFGMLALKKRYAFAAKPVFAIALMLAVSLEYHVPVNGRIIDLDSVAYIEKLDEANDGRTRLINLPMGRTNAKTYLFHQSLSGYPMTEGAIRRTPASAYDYIRANPILEAWHSQAPIVCSIETRSSYLSALDQLEADGFSNVVLHKAVGNQYTIIDSFRNVAPSYSDDYVSIYRLSDLRKSCPS